jgi:hypothetical protein
MRLLGVVEMVVAKGVCRMLEALRVKRKVVFGDRRGFAI